MTVTIYDIISANPVFTKILQHEFTAKQSFMISRLLRALNAETIAFNEVRETVLKKYAETDENGELIVSEKKAKIRDDAISLFQEEINELLYAKIQIDIKPIPIEWLNEVKLTPQESLILEPFVQFEE